MMSLYAQCMKERYGYEVIETEFGFITYRIDGTNCTSTEIFVRKECRGILWKQLWNELVERCRSLGVTKIFGFIDTQKEDPSSRLVAYVRYGAKVVEAKDNVIVLEWEI